LRRRQFDHCRSLSADKQRRKILAELKELCEEIAILSNYVCARLPEKTLVEEQSEGLREGFILVEAMNKEVSDQG